MHESKTSSSSWKILGYISLFLFIFVLLLIAFFPTFLSTNMGKHLASRFLSNKMEARVEIESLQLGWFTEQQIVGFEYQSHSSNITFSFEKFESEGKLWDFLLSRDFDAKTTITSPHLEIHYLPKDNKKASASKAPLALLIAKNLHLEDGQIIIQDTAQNKVAFQAISLDIQTGKESSEFKAKGETTYNNIAGNFNFTGTLDLKNIESLHDLAEQKLINLPIALEVQANRLPILGLDHLITIVDPNAKNLLYSIFGDVLNLNAKIDTSNPKLLFEIDALSPNLKASLHSESVATGLLLTKDSFISLNLQPYLYETLSKRLHLSQNISLTKPSLIKASIQQLFIPKIDQKLSFNNLACSFLFEVTQLGLSLNDVKQNLLINSITLSTQTKNLEDTLDVALQSSLNYQMKNPSLINLSFTVNKVLAQFKGLTRDLFSSFQLDVSKFPLPFIDSFLGKTKKISWWLGDFLNLKIQTKLQSGKIQYLISAATPLFNLPQSFVSIDESIFLEKPAFFTYLLNPDMLSFFASYPYFKTSDLTKVTGNIEAFGLSLENLSKRNFNNLIMQLELRLNDFKMTSSDVIGSLNILTPKVNINVESLEKVLLKLFAHAEYPNTEVFRHLIYGKYVDLDLTTTFDLADLKNIKAPSCKGLIKSDRVLLNYDFALLDNLSKLHFTKPIEGLVQPSPELLNTYFRPDNKVITYDPYIPIDVKIQVEPIDFRYPLFQHLVFDAQFLLKKFDFVNKSWIEEFSVEGINLHATGDSKNKTFKAELKANAKSKEVSSGVLSASVESKAFDSLDFYKNDSKISIVFDQFATRLLTSVMGLKPETDEILGSQFDLRLYIENINAIAKSQIDFHTTRLDLQGDFVFKDTISSGSRPLSLDVYIPEESYKIIQKLTSSKQVEAPFFIENPMRFHLKMPTFECPSLNYRFFSPETEKLSHLFSALRQSIFDLNVVIEKTTIRSNLDESRVELEDFKVALVKKELDGPALFNFVTDLKDLSKQTYNKKGLLSGAGQFNLPYYGQKSGINAEASLTLSSFPTIILDSFMKILQIGHLPPSLYLGQTVSGYFKTKVVEDSGPVELKLDSAESKVSIVGNFEDGILRLNQPLLANLKVTPALSVYMQKEMGIRSISAKNPLTLTISDKGFFLKIFPYDLSSLVVRDASLDLGQLICENSGNTQDLSGIFKQNLSSSSQINLWFQPMLFNIRSGMLTLSRTEFLYNKSLELALWGQVNLMKEYVKMVLGLTEQSLRVAFGLKGLPRSFVLQIPVEGPYGNIKINKDLATTRIALLIAKLSGITKQVGPFGNVIDFLGDLANDQKSVPPPRRPFPWEKELSELEEMHSRKNKVQIIR